MSEVIWLNRDDFERRVQQSAPTAGLWNKEDIFALNGIDIQLASFHDKGILFLRTRSNKFDIEEFAVRKVGDVWKFSLCSQEINKVKY